MTISLRALAMALLGALGAMQLVLWSFLGLSALGQVAGLAGLSLALWGVFARPGWRGCVGVGTLAVAMAAAFILLVLGGEGRWFYATPDWQVRDAVLRDMVLNPWPFAYDVGLPGGPVVLRAPLGIYLLPAVIGKWAGLRMAEWMLLAQDTLLLGGVLAMGAPLFANVRARWIALLVFCGFSGMDVLGQMLVNKTALIPFLQLGLGWTSIQFSAHVSQMFWAPQHALSGWVFAVFYLSWLDGRLPRAALFGAMPLLALLSPLALMGRLPFAAHALWRGLARRDLAAGDFVLPGLIAAICVPGLLYMATASGALAGHPAPLTAGVYVTFMVLEVGAWFYALWFGRGRWRFGPAPLAIAACMLMVAPVCRIGGTGDFAMRATIPALAVVAVMIAWLLGPGPASAPLRKGQKIAWVAFILGLATPVGEIGRAVIWPASPGVACSYFGVVPGGSATYVAPLAGMAGVIRPSGVAMVRPRDPLRCWPGVWPEPVTGRDTGRHPD
jgi:hypothetical protein